MKLSAVCKACDSKFKLDAAKISSCDIHLGDEILSACIMKCPHCEKEYIVQIDNEETKKILAKLKAKMREISNCINNGEGKTIKQMAQVKNLNCLLGRKRKRILSKYANEVNKQIGIECYFELLDF